MFFENNKTLKINNWSQVAGGKCWFKENNAFVRYIRKGVRFFPDKEKPKPALTSLQHAKENKTTHTTQSSSGSESFNLVFDELYGNGDNKKASVLCLQQTIFCDLNRPVYTSICTLVFPSWHMEQKQSVYRSKNEKWKKKKKKKKIARLKKRKRLTIAGDLE